MSKAKELTQRFIVNGIGIIILIFLISFANKSSFKGIFTSAVAIIQAIALWEYFQLIKQKSIQPAIGLGIAISILYIFAVFFSTQSEHFWQHIPSIILGFSVLSLFIYYAFLEQPLISISTTFFGIVYIAVPMSLIIKIVYFYKDNTSCYGCFWLIYLIAVTKAADTGAFFIGRKFGKLKLASKLSPNKTVEGALGGCIASIIVSILFFYIGKALNLEVFFNFWVALLLGLVLSIFGQIGDLAESLLKRDAKIKDSNKIPGVGGILDMIDSLLFTTPVVYLFLKLQ